MRFKFKGETYEIVKKPTIGEICYVERVTGVNIDDFHTGMAMASAYLIGVRRGQLARGLAKGESLLTWEDIQELANEDFEDIADPPAIPEKAKEEPEPDPTVAGSGSPVRQPRKRVSRKSSTAT